MPSLTHNQRGVLLMIVAAASFTINDTLLKLATEGLPPFETIVLRSFFAMLWGVPLLALTGGLPKIKSVVQPRVLGRNLLEMVAVLGFIVGLAHVPIAEFSALNQLAPIMLMLVAGLVLGLKVTRLQFGFAGLAFFGALMVAQPGGAAFSVFYLFGIWNAVCSAGRELVGRSVPPGISGVVVAFGAAILSLFGAGVAMLAFETFQMPDARQLVLVGLAALFLMGGHIFIFMAYRTADPGAVAPFVYTGMLWAVMSSLLVFGTLPNPLALFGMGLIVMSGVGVLVFGENGRRRALV